MPLEYEIDADARMVVTRGFGAVTAEDLFRYQREVWSRPEIAGFDELVDMTSVEQIVDPTPEGVRELADLSASMDVQSSPSRFAIVAPDILSYGLGRMYEVYRGMNEHSTKSVAVFRQRDEALRWLARSGDKAVPAPAPALKIERS
jgi:hypothetical protein